MIKIEGLDKLQKDIQQLEMAMAELDGDLGEVSFDPHDPGSIDHAIKLMERIIDDKVGPLANNEVVASIVESMKEEYRSGILQKAAAERIDPTETGESNG